MALSTSLPELFIAVAAGFSGQPEISLANLLGANVVNMSLVVGGATLVAGSYRSWVITGVGNWRQCFCRSGASPFANGWGLSRLDGFILVVIYLLYLEGVVIDGKKKSVAEASVAHRRGLLTRVKEWHRKKKDGSIGVLFLGIALMMFSAG